MLMTRIYNVKRYCFELLQIENGGNPKHQEIDSADSLVVMNGRC